MSFNRQVDKPHVIYFYNGILYSIKKEQTTDTCSNLDSCLWNYAEEKKPISKDSIYIMFLKWKNHRNEGQNRSGGARVGDRGCNFKGVSQGSFGGYYNRSVS